MRKVDRLFDIIQFLRDGRLHTGREIAERLEVSLRTIYRDIDGLVASGVPISGERGVGFMMTEPVFLPPLNVAPGELEALELGMALVQATYGGELGAHAMTLGQKIRAVLPARQLLDPERSAVGVYTSLCPPEVQPVLALARRAILSRTCVSFDYLALAGARSARVVRPLEIEHWQGGFTLTGWCETKNGFRVFRVDRIEGLTLLDHGFRAERGKGLADYMKTLDMNHDRPRA